jgi:Est1 DNA/RNA binding domain
MGDLHRYAESYNKAETYYLNASKLGPGYGNPYNQLAVVNYNRDNYCNSLYWYARSLLATHEAFTTSSGNLERLFVSNREKLQEYGRDSKPTILTDDKMMMMISTIPTNTSRSEKRSNKGDYQSSLKERKKSASKSFLAHFVDLQYDFFLLCQRKEDIEIVDILENMRQKMSAIAASLESIQQFYAFGDSLFCRLVVINAFHVRPNWPVPPSIKQPTCHRNDMPST